MPHTILSPIQKLNCSRLTHHDQWYSTAGILKHEYIALRFVTQPAYERAASLSIPPQPDIVTRVFMLFREKDVAWWADVVGVDLARASDMALFRVLEWGGMEVRI
ncbi:hypothetical protein BDR05DRAFT_1001911 [Suillus weaverae]|nr:hypothetical protein BDR05DRAFT_1006452 [Suillus weaverae]KAG2341265.1 hypothetical protein BDR05DRAFT_1001911 [Suillus weaverae]